MVGKSFPIALNPHEGHGYFGPVTENTLSGLWRKPNFHFPMRDLSRTVKLLLKLFHLKASDKEQAYFLAHCTFTLQSFPSISLSPQLQIHDIGGKVVVPPFYSREPLLYLRRSHLEKQSWFQLKGTPPSPKRKT